MSEHRMLHLSRSDVARLSGASSKLYVEAVENALRRHAERRFVQPLKPYLRWRGGDNHIADVDRPYLPCRPGHTTSAG